MAMSLLLAGGVGASLSAEASFEHFKEQLEAGRTARTGSP